MAVRLSHPYISDTLQTIRGCRFHAAVDLWKWNGQNKITSWSVNSIRARLEHVSAWLELQSPDVLLLQELKGAEFSSLHFKELAYESVAVTQKAYNGVAILSTLPILTVSTTLPGDDADSHTRYLEVVIGDLKIVNIYLPNGNPPGSDNFAYKLAWMDRLQRHLQKLSAERMPVVVGGDFNVIPEDIDCHKPSSWLHNALFQPESRDRYRALLKLGYTNAFRSLHPGEGGHFTFWDYFRRAFKHNRGNRIDNFQLSAASGRLKSCEIDLASRSKQKPLKQAGAKVHYIEYPGIRHDSWDKAVDEPKLFPWLFSKTPAPQAR